MELELLQDSIPQRILKVKCKKEGKTLLASSPRLKAGGFPPSQVGLTVSPESAFTRSCLPYWAYVSSAVLTFPEPQGSSPFCCSAVPWFSGLVEERESVQWSNTLVLLRKGTFYLATLKHYSVVKVLKRV